jgi:integrase
MAVVGSVRHKLCKGRENKDEARRRLRGILTLRDLNPCPETGPLTVAAVIEKFLEHAAKVYAERSLYERRLILQSFAEAHGFRAVNDKNCVPYRVTDRMDEHPEWASSWTKAHVIAVVQRPFNWAAKQRLIPANPFRGVSHRQGEPRRPMTDDEFDRLIVAAKLRKTKTKKPVHPGDRFIELLRFLRLSGARTCEASRLRWSNINIENAEIVFNRHKTSSTQRTPKPRVIPLHPEVIKLLISIRERNEPGPHVFHTHRGTPWNRSNLSLRMQRAREKANIPNDVKLYGLRHAFGTRAIVNGVDLKTLAELMGHTTTRITENYVHLAGKRSHLAASMLRVNDSNPIE